MIIRVARQRRRRGFTLIESISAVSVLATLGAGTSLLIIGAVDSYTEATTAAQLHAELSIALDRAAREIRMIDLDRDASGIAPDIIAVGDTFLAWQDTDGDNYSLTLAGNNMFMQINGVGGTILLGDVSAIQFKAFDQDNTEILLPAVNDACDPVRRISLEVTLQRGDVTESLRCRVFIRSTMRLGGS